MPRSSEIRPVLMSPLQAHKRRWENCRACPLHEGRKKVVLVRGKIPCDALFIGEGPGGNEDSLGSPFVGPAGKLLDRIVEDAMSGRPLETKCPDCGRGVFRSSSGAVCAGGHSGLLGESEVAIRLAFTNLVACIPWDEDRRKVRAPERDEIEACSDRLNELVQIARPRAIVTCGKVPTKYLVGQAKFGDPWWLPDGDDGLVRFVEIVHPAAILQADKSQQGLMVQRATRIITDLLDELDPIPF